MPVILRNITNQSIALFTGKTLLTLQLIPKQDVLWEAVVISDKTSENYNEYIIQDYINKEYLSKVILPDIPVTTVTITSPA